MSCRFRVQMHFNELKCIPNSEPDTNKDVQNTLRTRMPDETLRPARNILFQCESVCVRARTKLIIFRH
jgi:hypothetical protein